MVTYLPSSIQSTINVRKAEVATILTGIIPTDALPGEAFRIGGELRRSDTNQILAGETITATYNGTVLGFDVTAGNGEYNIDGVIHTVGSYNVVVSFAGSERSGFRFAPSDMIARIGIGITEMNLWLKGALILGGVVVIGLAARALIKKK